MSKSIAQPVTVSLAVPQTVTIDNPVEDTAVAQAITVTMGTDYILVAINPAITLPQG